MNERIKQTTLSDGSKPPALPSWLLWLMFLIFFGVAVTAFRAAGYVVGFFISLMR